MTDLLRIVCNHASCEIRTYLNPHVARDLSGLCAYEVEGARYMPAVRNGRWDGKIRLYHRRWRTFPSGLLSRVGTYLYERDIPYEVLWRDGTTDEIETLSLCTDKYEPYPYQEQAIDRAIREAKCVLRIATGGGKTICAGHIIDRLKRPTIFLVHTKDLLYQARTVFSDMFGEENVGQVGDSVVDIAPITVCTIQTAARTLGIEWQDYDYEDAHWQDFWNDDLTSQGYEEIRYALEDAGLVFFDEVHRVAAPTAMDVMSKLENAEYRIGLSASPWRDDGADLAIEAALGPVVSHVTASDLYRQGYLVRPIIRFMNVPPMFFESARYDTVYKEYISENEERNRIGVNEAVRLIDQGKPTMVLVRLINHGERVSRLLSDSLGHEVPFLSGDDPSDVRNDVLNRMRSGDLPALVATTIADEGLDLKPLQGLVLLGGGKSSVKALQRIGRTLRTWPGKEDAEIIDFMDNTKWLYQHSQARMKIYETEPEWIIMDF